MTDKEKISLIIQKILQGDCPGEEVKCMCFPRTMNEEEQEKACCDCWSEVILECMK